MDVEPDGYLFNLLRDPQAVESGPEIKPLDAETLKDAFSLKEGPVPGVCLLQKYNSVPHLLTTKFLASLMHLYLVQTMVEMLLRPTQINI